MGRRDSTLCVQAWEEAGVFGNVLFLPIFFLHLIIFLLKFSSEQFFPCAVALCPAMGTGDQPGSVSPHPDAQGPERGSGQHQPLLKPPGWALAPLTHHDPFFLSLLVLFGMMLKLRDQSCPNSV